MPPKKKVEGKQKGIKKGKIVLKSTLTALQKNALSKLEEKININGFRWELVNGLFLQCQVRSILQATQQLNINHLGLANNKHPNIIYDLCIFNPYQKLQNLIMRTKQIIKAQNRIQSLEAITYINAPLLWRIDFSENLICDMRAFRKMHCPKLVMFRIGNNFVSNLGGLETCYSPELIEVSVQGNLRLNCINQLFKIHSSQQFRQIYAVQSGLIGNKAIRKKFLKRFNQLDFQT